jgi:Domain of Unknown Function with PDB structure (DUF3865)
MSAAEAIAEGRRRIEEVAPFLNAESNVLLAEGRILTREEMTRVLLSFSALSRALPGILRLGLKSCAAEEPAGLYEEIMLNLSEELGEIEAIPGLEGQTHYSVLRAELVSFLGVDPEDEVMPLPTIHFIEQLRETVTDNAAKTYGALLALETTAIPEILVFKVAVQRFCERDQSALPPTLAAFFDAHTGQFEVQHAARLRKLYYAFDITNAVEESMDDGFNRVIAVMTEWWSSIAEPQA